MWKNPAPSHPLQALTPSSHTGVAVIAFGNKGLGNQHPTWGKPHCCHSNRGLGRAQRLPGGASLGRDGGGQVKGGGVDVGVGLLQVPHSQHSWVLLP